MLQELLDYETWPASVQRGVHLLAWMVAKGFLDIRVAFRVHSKTGEVLFAKTRGGYKKGHELL
ncbi:hypothetical protein MTBBW1_410015 [Desulfamplus magnetovallimortis]|uniref:Uncharacterized protein n=1 Tax=Desulfamplus magnetovallimortis TaxID=1246637 RepID=A0A1W1HGS1_9BACT|nr:hypothetical protein [Desulfamplus magnetovallimortis]SLM31660.1 hypothetical protein MTBBW1_410015 [Desulfamplus magnetovallimortis]